jgi:hypothetical protein
LLTRLLKRVAKVFGKYPHAELRNMGREYLKFYQLLHAVERPVDLSEFEKVDSVTIRHLLGIHLTFSNRTLDSFGSLKAVKTKQHFLIN